MTAVDRMILGMVAEHAGADGWAPVFNGWSWRLLCAHEASGLVERTETDPPVAAEPSARTGKGWVRLTARGRDALAVEWVAA